VKIAVKIAAKNAHLGYKLRHLLMIQFRLLDVNASFRILLLKLGNNNVQDPIFK